MFGRLSFGGCFFNRGFLGRRFRGSFFFGTGLGLCFLGLGGGRFLCRRLGLGLFRCCGLFRCLFLRRSLLRAVAADAGDFYFGVELPMRALAQIVLAPLELDDVDFLRLTLAQDLAADATARQQRIADLDVSALADQEDLVERDRGALVGLDFLEAQDVTFCRAVLFAAGAKNRIHRVCSVA